MIYKWYIFCKGGVEIWVLAVRDDERDRGDNVGGYRGEGHVWKSHGNGTEHVGTCPWFPSWGTLVILGTGNPRNPCVLTGRFG